VTATRTKPDPRTTPTELITRHRWWLVGGGCLIVAVVLLVILWPSTTTRALPPTRARHYTAFQACLLTDGQGLADPNVQAVWSGMQDASLATHAKVSYLAVAGPQTEGNAEPYANTLVQRQCSLIIAVGQSQVAAVESVARTHPRSRFAVAGGHAASNVTVLDADRQRTSVDSLIEGLAR
jgi:basic membrane lipoprotein Med (substrate-binding protein (PBP1-ABC) superfamily)